MKKLVIILILIFSFQSFAKADDIREFEIEGITTGDSVLKYKSLYYVKQRLKHKYTFYYKDNKFAVIGLDISSNLFDAVSATIKPNDEKYIIYAIEGRLFFKNDYEGCKIKLKEISDDVLSIFPNKNFRTLNDKHSYDKTGKSFYYANILNLLNGSIEIYCFDWSKEIMDKDGFDNELKVVITSNEFRKWIDNEAYN